MIILVSETCHWTGRSPCSQVGMRLTLWGRTCLQWCRAGLSTAGGCLSNYFTLKSLWQPKSFLHISKYCCGPTQWQMDHMDLPLCRWHGHSGYALHSLQLSANAFHCQQKRWFHQRLPPALIQVLKTQNYSTINFLSTHIRTLRDELVQALLRIC